MQGELRPRTIIHFKLWVGRRTIHMMLYLKSLKYYLSNQFEWSKIILWIVCINSKFDWKNMHTLSFNCNPGGFSRVSVFFRGGGGGQGVKLHGIIVRFSWRCFVSIVNFRYWCKFHINIIIGCGVITISFCKGLTRNPEIGNTPVWILQNIWRLG